VQLLQSLPGTPIAPAKAKAACQPMLALCLRLFLVLSLTVSVAAWGSPKARTDETQGLVVQVESPEADVVKAVQQVAQDQIIHGTYSYDKERILYGAHGANSARAFGVWPGPGKVYYKTADRILSPRFFKDSEDIGTISVRYIIQDESTDAVTLRIDAVFVDARNVRHPSMGLTVESAEYGAIQTRLKDMQAIRNQALEAAAQPAAQAAQPDVEPLATLPPPISGDNGAAAIVNVQQLQEQIESLRHQVFLRVKDPGASLKSAPFDSAASISSLPAETEVVIEVLTPYWYGVETKDGHRGWIHHSQLESLP
jgi:hypothetical protein